MSWQNVTIVGNLGRDPELRKTQGGQSIASFSVAVNEGSGNSRTTTWFRCVAWEKTAELVDKYFRKGDVILCSGRLRTRTCEKDGKDVDTWELVVREVGFPGGNAGGKDDDRGGSRERSRDDDRGRNRDDDRGRSRRSDDDDFDKPLKSEDRGRGSRRRDELDDEIPF